MFIILVSEEQPRSGTCCTRQYRKQGADSLFHGVYSSDSRQTKDWKRNVVTPIPDGVSSYWFHFVDLASLFPH